MWPLLDIWPVCSRILVRSILRAYSSPSVSPRPCCSLSSGPFSLPSPRHGPTCTLFWGTGTLLTGLLSGTLGGDPSLTPLATWTRTSNFLFLGLGFRVSEYVLHKAGYSSEKRGETHLRLLSTYSSCF